MHQWSPEGLGGPPRLFTGPVPPFPMGKASVAALVGAPSCRHPWRGPITQPGLSFVQCKLEQQACLSSKQLMVRCEGPCPCPTEQAASTTDGKPGNEEHWVTDRIGGGGGYYCQGSGMVRKVHRVAREK